MSSISPVFARPTALPVRPTLDPTPLGAEQVHHIGLVIRPQDFDSQSHAPWWQDYTRHVFLLHRFTFFCIPHIPHIPLSLLLSLHMHTHTYIYIYDTCICVYVYTYIYIYTHVYVYKYNIIYLFIYLFDYLYACVFTHVYIIYLI